jgi:hypothetical protein
VGGSAKQAPALPNAGPAKDAIVKFVHATADAASRSFAPLAERIAIVDQHVTLCGRTPDVYAACLAAVFAWRCACCTTTKSANMLRTPRKASPKPKPAAFSPELYDEAITDGWIVVSMKNDGKRIFAFGR